MVGIGKSVDKAIVDLRLCDKASSCQIHSEIDFLPEKTDERTLNLKIINLYIQWL